MREEGTTQPSPRAVQRLASDVGGEVSDLRAALRHALDEADRYEADGRPDRAAAVLAEQQDVLAAVHQRLEDRLAEAAVEREAEGVLAAAEQAPDGAVEAELPVAAPPVAPGRRDDEGMGLRVLASAAAAVVGVVLLLAPEAGGMLTVAGWSSIEDGGATEAARPGDPGEREASSGEALVVVPVWPALRDLAVPEAFDLRPRPASDDPADGQVTDRTQPSPPESGGLAEQVLDGLEEVEDLAETALDAGAATDQGTDGGTSEDDGAQHDAEADGAPPAAEDDTGSANSSEQGGTTTEDETVGAEDSVATDDGGDSSTDPDDGTATSAETDGEPQDDQQDDAQDDPQPEGSSATAGLDGLASSDDETTGAGR